MLLIPGHAPATCEGWSRREWLRVGGLGPLGLSLNGLWQQSALGATQLPSFGRAKACIVLFMFGGPAHQDTWDLKPQSPREVRGEFVPIGTTVPGLEISEHFPRLAQQADRYTVIRSLTHPDNTHTIAMHAMLSGVRHIRPATNPQQAADDFPCYGAVVNRFGSQLPGLRAREAGLPPAISLNSPANQVSANNHIFPGFFAGFLGSSYDPLFVSQHPDQPDFQPLPAVENAGRLRDRQALLGTLERNLAHVERTVPVENLRADYAKAFQLLTSARARSAFALDEEAPELRARYGSTPFGQGCLLARRLVERGVPLVTVNWERDDAYWDTHADNFNLHRKTLMPNLDAGFSTLLEDLQQRGLLDETLIVCLGEFGRSPHINKEAGRDHWAPCNTVILAGAGTQGGTVYGASDAQAAYPSSQAVTPADLSATIYHLLGLDLHTEIHDSQGRPYVISRGEPIWGVV